MTSDYQLGSDGAFQIKNYDQKKPFSNFLPGIAGLYGTPMWVFYVNRGQAIASFGTRNKDNAILEFFPANKAYQVVTSHGFRTFLKTKPAGTPGDRYVFREPFSTRRQLSSSVSRSMEISSHELAIRERDQSSGLETSVTYFTVPGEPIAALARIVTISNLSSEALDIEMLDGLPQVNPYGMNEFFVKQMSRTIEAWMVVENLEKRAPFLRLKVDATDRSEVTMIEGGNFYAAFGLGHGSKTEPLEVWTDPAVLFGSALDFSIPRHFFNKADFKAPFKAIHENKTPCVFSFSEFKLPPGKSKTVCSLAGQARSVVLLNRYLSKVKRSGYFEAKRQENRELIEGLKTPVFTVSASSAFDAYSGQTYLDNILRGGTPVCLGDPKEPLVYYVYSRKHGDLERDYNRFLVEDSYFSQGDGNYRDVNQNRRHDVWFEPRVGDANIKTFLNLIQLDGFNPLIVKGAELHFRKTPASKKALSKFFRPKTAVLVGEYLSKPFKLGEFCRWLGSVGDVSPARFEKLIRQLSPFLEGEEKAEHGEGFWVDHWTYNLDLVESYLAIYPERLRMTLIEKRDHTFFDDAHRVRPRDEKYHMVQNAGVRQYQAVFLDKEKAVLIAGRKKEKNLVRTRHGKGEIYRTTLLSKLLCIFVNKLASLDARGVGIEMEADKPSWYDALNGLPGLLGSSICETFELKRLALFLIQCLEALAPDAEDAVVLPEEIFEFLVQMEGLLSRFLRGDRDHDVFRFWQEATTFKEKYRRATAMGISGAEKKIALLRVRSFLEHAREKIDIGIEKAFEPKSGLYWTYFENEVSRHRPAGNVAARPLAFRSKPLPFFLEGAVHAMKVEKDPARRKALYAAVRRSALYDAKLGMYKVCGPLQEASMEVGRARVFTPGWLENESIWLHMEYKYLLEVLNAGMNEEFFEDARKSLVPFQPAERYGRSILENSSFIVSSVFPDAALHGTGFVARLSGSTAEFIHLWLLMNVGKRPFVLGPDGKVSLRFEPHLPAFLFTDHECIRVYVDRKGQRQALKLPKDSLAFLFLGKTLVVYSNRKKLDTFGKVRASVRSITLHDTRGRKMEFKGDTVPSPYSLKVRDEFVPRIDIELG